MGIVEIWKDIPDYEGCYQASSLGNIKSLRRCDSRGHLVKEKVLKGGLSRGYLTVNLRNNNKTKNYKIHKLIAITFLDHKPNRYELVVNHKDFNRLNNRVENLELVTNRENTNQKHMKSTSKYIGVSWNKAKSRWRAAIRIKGELVYLGSFMNEIDA